MIKIWHKTLLFITTVFINKLENLMNKLSVLVFALGMSLSIFAQEYNPISTSVAFLNISPESRGSALGDAGAATSSDVYSQFWNPAKYAFIDDQFGLGLSYTPWLRELVNDIGLVNLTGYYRFDDVQTVSGSLRYFSMGEIQWTDDQGESQGVINPNEFAIDMGYSRKFSDNWSGAVVFRYIRSDIFSGYAGGEAYPGNAYAVDMAAYYNKKDIYVADYPAHYAFGMNISNVGSKISYDNGTNKLFIPANMKLGGSFGIEIDDYNSIMGTLDLNKLLVPTPPGNDSISDEYNDMGSLKGIITSFGDAPGGFKEEMQEIMVSVGVEYTYDDAFSVRGGYFYEHENKGNREFFSVGAGFKMNVFALDVSYLVPTDSQSPLANTLRFSLSFGVDGLANIFGQ